MGYAILTVVVIAITSLIYKMTKDAVDQKSRQDAKKAQLAAAEERLLNRRRSQQENFLQQLIGVCNNSAASFEAIPQYLLEAERHLDRADVDFADGAFAPFWDSIEKAAISLGHFTYAVQRIKDDSVRYTQVVKHYRGTPPEFPVATESVTKLGVGSTTADRMKNTVHKAQRNFQFATIYEQRKTNQILIAGFKSLAQALDGMSYRIVSAIGDLANSVGGLATSVEAMNSTIETSSHAIRSQIGLVVETNIQHHDHIMRESADRARREKTALEMLDNIQRGRRPLL